MKTKFKQGGTFTMIKIAYRNIWRNKRRSLFCLSAVGLAVFFLVFYGSFQDGQIKGVEEVCKIIGADTLAYLNLENLTKITPEARDTGVCMACFTGNYPVL